MVVAQLCVQNCGQTAADRDLHGYYCQPIQEVVFALSSGTIADPLRFTV